MYTISALAKTGTQQVVYDIMNYLIYDYEESEQDSFSDPDVNVDDEQN